MNTKKLIGTIVGVTAFAILIAGATFAMLSATAVVNNSVYNGTSKNFIINYNGSAAVSGFKQISSGSATVAAITSSTSAGVANDAWAAVTASKTANDAPASSFKIKLAITENTLTTNSIVWALCKGNCPTGTALATVSGGSAACGSGVTKCGTITAGSKTEVELYNDTTTFNTDSAVSATTYNIYFWLDNDTITNDDLGTSFAGYIHASATQAG